MPRPRTHKVPWRLVDVLVFFVHDDGHRRLGRLTRRSPMWIRALVDARKGIEAHALCWRGQRNQRPRPLVPGDIDWRGLGPED